MGFLKFFPLSDFSVSDFRKKIYELGNATARIMAAETFEEALQACAEAARKLTGFARIKIYQFQPDWSGKVVAEDRAEHMPSYLGLFFPESDIPKQVRYLMQLVPYRGIANADDQNANIVSTPAASPQPTI